MQPVIDSAGTMPVLASRHVARVVGTFAAMAAMAEMSGCTHGAGRAAPDGATPQASWYAGGATCARTPAFRIREYRPGVFILRQPACTNYEARELRHAARSRHLGDSPTATDPDPHSLSPR